MCGSIIQIFRRSSTKKYVKLIEEPTSETKTKTVAGILRMRRFWKRAKPEASSASVEVDSVEEKQDNQPLDDSTPNRRIFGVDLPQLDKNGLPEPVLAMMQCLSSDEGLSTEGIFRKNAKQTTVQELREQIESTGDTNCLKDAPILAVGALLKDFLRSLPDPLLTSRLYPLWKQINLDSDTQTIKNILDQLPRANYILLSHLVCLLHHIAKPSNDNKMNANNLGICVGQNLLRSNSPSVEEGKFIPTITEKLILDCEELFGEGVTQLLGEMGSRLSLNSDSGLSSDSVDLVEAPGQLQTSLSLDSGLALSDCQLFIPEEEVEILDYSSHNFKRQDWLRTAVKRIPRKFGEEQQQKDIFDLPSPYRPLPQSQETMSNLHFSPYVYVSEPIFV